MRRKFLFRLSVVMALALGSHTVSFAVVYETCNTGTWGSNSGNSSIRFSTNGGATCTINPYSITWAAGDKLVIKSGTTLTLNANVSISPMVTVVIEGNIIFDNGKLNLDDATSKLTLMPSGSLTCNAGCGSNDQITIGSGGSKYQYKGSDLVAINDHMPRPTTVGNSGTILPIVLLYFEALPIASSVDLNWATAMEKDFEKFIVERSSTGLNFESIGEVPGQGKNIFNVETEYQFSDAYPLTGFNYYRLKALDLDGKFDYSSVRVVRVDGPRSITVLPNPSTGRQIGFRINFNPSDGDRVVLTNSLGLKIAEKPVRELENQLVFDNALAPGVYLLRYVSREFCGASRVLVSH